MMSCKVLFHGIIVYTNHCILCCLFLFHLLAVVEGAVVVNHIENSELYIIIIANYRCPIENDTPKMIYLNRYVTKEYATMWRDVGLELNLQPSVLNTIEANNPQDAVKRFEVVLDKWLKLAYKATWRELEVALTNANRMLLGLDPVDKLYA